MKKALRFLGIFLLCLLALAVITVGPIDRTPLEQQAFYQRMLKKIDNLTFRQTEGSLKSSWGKVNITPHKPQPLAGYLLRPRFNSVRDSLFCHIVAIQNNRQTVFILNVDLLLFPSSWRQNIVRKWRSEFPEDDFYFCATHTHNGVGGFDKSLAGTAIFGYYRKSWMDSCENLMGKKMQALRSATRDSEMAYWESEETHKAANRFCKDSLSDSRLRGFQIQQTNGKKLIVFSFAGHPTSISKYSRVLSADYPAAVITELEKKGYDGLFLCGMVGSEKMSGWELDDYIFIDSVAKSLSKSIFRSPLSSRNSQIKITSAHIPIEFGPSQLRIARDWRVRNLAFTAFLSPLKGEFTFLQLNNIILIGTPCDFSGELFLKYKLENRAAANGKKLIITSFNGDYVGYITHDDYYDTYEDEDVRALNWTGPYFGKYFSQSLKRIIQKAP